MSCKLVFFVCGFFFFCECLDYVIQNGLMKYIWKNMVFTAEHLCDIRCLYFLELDRKPPQLNNLLSPLFSTTLFLFSLLGNNFILRFQDKQPSQEF